MTGNPLATEQGLQDLVTSQVAEGKTIEYKEHLPGGNDGDKHEFLADVSSFANASGGHLLFGIDEEHGIATEVRGLGEVNVDAVKGRFENMLRDGLDPRIPSLSIYEVALEGRGPVIVIHILRSWAGPHMITFKNSSRFYSRNSTGKYQLDVQELRSAFVGSEVVAERIRRFRADRLGKIVAGEAPALLADPTRVIVLHAVPLSTFEPGRVHDLAALTALSADFGDFGVGSGNRTIRLNFDGLLSSMQDLDGNTASYTQVFRTGAIEAVNAHLLASAGGAPPRIPSVPFERVVIGALTSLLGVERLLGVDAPILIMLTLLGVRGMVLGVQGGTRPDLPIDRDDLLVPDLLVEGASQPPAAILRPAFDMVWNAAGWPRSMNYGEDGAWSPR